MSSKLTVYAGRGTFLGYHEQSGGGLVFLPGAL
jgi:hypothetical protein